MANLQRLPNGKLLKLANGKLAIECCCVDVPGGECDSYPLRWLATIAGITSKPHNGGGLLVFTDAFFSIVSDPDSRFLCELRSGLTATFSFSGSDWTASNGSHLCDPTGINTWSNVDAGDTINWAAGAPLGSSDYSITNVGTAPTAISIGVVEECKVGPGDVTIGAALFSGPITGAAWEKTITLAPGQKLRDVGSITLDPQVSTSYVTYNFSTLPNCDITLPVLSMPSIVLTPHA